MRRARRLFTARKLFTTTVATLGALACVLGLSVAPALAAPAAPSVLSESVSGVGSATVATLEAVVNPNEEETHYAFEYSTKATGETLEGTITRIHPPYIELPAVEPTLPPVLAELPIGLSTDPLEPATTYYYRAVAENEASQLEEKPAYGHVQSFTTQPLPVVSTGEAAGITRDTATFAGTVNPEGANTTYYFAYINEAGYRAALAEHAGDPYADGETTTPESAGAGEAPQAVGPVPTDTLLPETTYHYALIAKDVLGVTVGPDRTFTTLSRTPPVVSTGGASGIGQATATISGTVATGGEQTTYGFEIGTEPENYGPPTGLGNAGGAVTETVSLSLGELQPGATYYYRITATNADGAVRGASQSFTTNPLPTLFTVPASPALVPTPAIAFPTGSQANTGTIQTKALTNAQKLANALKVCRKGKKSKRASCEKQAHKKYGPATKKKK
jgi:hypothetical protein